MDLHEIEAFLNTVAFKDKVENLFPQPLRDKIDFDFSITVKKPHSHYIEVKAFDTSYDCDGMGIPTLTAAIVVNTLDCMESNILYKFKEYVDQWSL